MHPKMLADNFESHSFSWISFHCGEMSEYCISLLFCVVNVAFLWLNVFMPFHLPRLVADMQLQQHWFSDSLPGVFQGFLALCKTLRCPVYSSRWFSLCPFWVLPWILYVTEAIAVVDNPVVTHHGGSVQEEGSFDIIWILVFKNL